MIGMLCIASAAAVTVTSNADSGPGTLRDAILNAAVDENIDFDELSTIVLLTPLPPITADGVEIRGGPIVDGSMLSSGNGLVIEADGVIILNMTLLGFPDAGIVVREVEDALIGDYSTVSPPGDRGNVVQNCGSWGIVVEQKPQISSVITVAGNIVDGNCVAAGSTTCGGIGVRDDAVNVYIRNNWVHNTQSGGHGIVVRSGSGHHVYDNTIGILGGNGGDGLLIAASTGDTVGVDYINGNEIGNNVGAGILLGARSLPSTMYNNYVGVTSAGVAAPNGGVGIRVFGSDGHSIGTSFAGNVVSGNLQSGIRIHGQVAGSPAELVTVDNNIVGLDPTGTNTVGNSNAGIRIEGPSGISTEHQIKNNVVSGNAADGIRVEGDGNTVSSNFVGLDPDGTLDLGNNGHGLYINGSFNMVDEGDFVGERLPNVISGNEGEGIHIFGGDANSILRNWIGPDISQANLIGNGGDGVRIVGGDYHTITGNQIGGSGGSGIAIVATAPTTIENINLDGNQIFGNLAEGILLDGSGADFVRMTKNTVWSNGTCATRLADEANGTPGNQAPNQGVHVLSPEIVFYTNTMVTGNFTVPLGETAEAIEIFTDSVDEARTYVGRIDFPTPPTFTLQVGDTDPNIGPGVRVSATLILINGQTSGLEAWCEDGCTPFLPSNTCNDGNTCTTDSCKQNIGCEYVADLGQDGLNCDDGNDCSIDSTCASGICVPGMPEEDDTSCNDGDACTSTSTCQGGSCEGSVDVECVDPLLGDCFVADCDAVEGCAMAAWPAGSRCDDGDMCTLSETCDSFGNCLGAEPIGCPAQTDCNICTCASTPGPMNDPPGGCSCTGICNDGICGPHDIYLKCPECGLDNDGNVIDTDNDGFPDVWEDDPLGVDLDCDGIIDVDPTSLNSNETQIFVEIDYLAQGPMGEVHMPDTSVDGLPVVTTRFFEEGITLEYVVDDEIPHIDVIRFKDIPPTNPLTVEWEYFDALKRDYFDPAHRGLYHYAIFGHKDQEAVGGGTGTGELYGDDFVVVHHEGTDPGRDRRNFMHELGHNLGLNHGGFEKFNHKANYQSIMNYTYQNDLLVPVNNPQISVPDYSHWELWQLDENFLVESLGVNPPNTGDTADGWQPGDPIYFLRYDCQDSATGNWSQVAVSPYGIKGDEAIDFNCNGVIKPGFTTNADLEEQKPDGDIVIHIGYDDWLNLNIGFLDKWSFRNGGVGGAGGTIVEEEPHGSPLRFVRPTATFAPGCPQPQIPEAAGYRVPLVVFGESPAPDPADLVEAQLAFAPTTSMSILDIDNDGIDDLVLNFEVDDMSLALGADRAHFRGITSEGRRVLRTFAIERPQSVTDSDGDGLHDTCDVCPSQAAPSYDGCP